MLFFNKSEWADQSWSGLETLCAYPIGCGSDYRKPEASWSVKSYRTCSVFYPYGIW
jgi:hypothetical protein